MADMMDFVAIDFETANEKRSSACAIGLTTVREGQIVDSFSRLIRPPELRFSFWNSKVHGLTENDVKDSPTFDELWPELLPLLENQIVVAHNASFDISVLRHSCGLRFARLCRS
jgi:DNA polymerase III subunit epsilon